MLELYKNSMITPKYMSKEQLDDTSNTLELALDIANTILLNFWICGLRHHQAGNSG